MIGGGGGIVVLEDLEHALARGAKIYAEVTGYGATSDGHDMVAPSGEGGERAMRLALQSLNSDRKVSYINATGHRHPLAMWARSRPCAASLVRDQHPCQFHKIHDRPQPRATGAQEAIYCLLMLDNDFIAPSINVETLDPALDPAEIATSLVENAGLDTVMTNSFGFGGTNGSMLMSKYRG